ncbi:MAG: YfhO family protein [Bryobacterales bacterium]|nr:YfhO family protein [Bryobacterales bacterium]
MRTLRARLRGPAARLRSLGARLLGPAARLRSLGARLVGPGSRLRPLGWRFVGPAVLALLIVGFFWKLALSDEFLWIDSPDITNQVVPWFQFQASEWHAGRFPLWDPYLWCGQPVLGQVIPAAANPLNWVLFLMPLNNGWLQLRFLDGYFVGIHILAGWLAFWLCRDRGLGRAASVFGGLAFSLSGWLGANTWPQMFNGAIWTPAVLLFLLRAVEGKRPAASSLLAGFFLGLAWLSGHHQAPIFLTLAAVLVWCWAVLRSGRIEFRTLALVLAFLVSFALTSGLQTLPALEYGRLAVRWAGAPEPVRWGQKVPYAVHQNFSLSPAYLLGIAVPGVEEHVNPFAGVTILTLAALGVIGGWKQAWVRLVLLISAFGLLVALGTNTPLEGLLYALVPMVEKARSAAVSIFIFNFGLAILSACGLNYLLDDNQTPLVRRTGLVLVAMAALIWFVGLLAHLAQKDSAGPGIWIPGLAALVAGCLLLAFDRQAINRGWLITGLVTMMLTELTVGGLIGGLPNRHAPNRNHLIDALAGAPDLVSFLRVQPRPFRLGVNEKDVQFNFGDWHGIETTGGYLASLTLNIYDMETHLAPLQRLMGARYYLSKAPQREDQRLVFEDPSGLKLFENPDVFPRAWVVHRLFVADRKHEVLGFILDKTNLLQTVAPILNRDLPLEQCSSADQLRIVENRPGRTVIDAELGCRGMLVVSDLYFPGWEATVDGRRTGIHEVYGFLRGVVVEGGQHRIEMSYRPRSVYVGGVMTAAGAVLALAAALSGRGRRKSAILTF